MKKPLHLVAAASTMACLAALPMSAWSDDADPRATDPIAAYLADLGPGAISASEILGISGSAVSTLEAPKDFVAALNTLASGSGAAFGLAFTPARTRLTPVSLAAYRSDAAGAWLTRAWAGTTFSYAQDTQTFDGADYRRRAAAIHVSLYLHRDEDPVVAAYQAFVDCKPLKEMQREDALRQASWAAKFADNPKLLPAAETQDPEEAKTALQRAVDAHDACVSRVAKDASAKWNASQFGATFGQSWIQGTDAGAPRLTLGKQASMTLALGVGPDGLVNITVRRVADALDTSTLASTLARSSSTLAGARFTYKPDIAKGLFALAELSNAKGASAGQSNDVFKAALGVDKRISDGLWLQLRVGRNHTSDGTSTQTTTLMGLKFSPGSTLPVEGH